MRQYSILLITILFAVPGVAQERNMQTNDSLVFHLYDFYYQTIGIEDKLINGKEYVPYYHRSKSKPLFHFGIDRTSSLKHGGRLYNDLILQYDTFTDELIYTDQGRIYNNIVYQVALNKELIEEFTLFTGRDTINFRNFKKTDQANFNLTEGFYEVVYDGRSRYLIKHQSVYIKKNGVDEYVYRPAGFVMTKDKYIKIRSIRGLVKQFGKHSDEVRRFIRNSGNPVRKADKHQIAEVLKFYDNLIKAE
jgi:hypothetical protein